MSLGTHPTLEKAKVFLESQAHAPTAAEGSFVTISRESGAGAPELAEMLVERLNREDQGGRSWTVFGANLIEEMLRANRLSPRLANFLPEERIFEINALIGEMVGLHPSLWGLIQKTKGLTQALARKGQAIFVGRGAAFSTAGIANGVHVRLVAPKELRTRRTTARLNLSLEAAAAYNKRQDAAHRAYVKANFNARGPDPIAYDFVINTARVSLLQAAETIVSLVQARTPSSI